MTPDLRRVAVIVDRYPCLSESFVRRELAYLESVGFTLAVFTCSRALPSDILLSPGTSFPVFSPRAHTHPGRRRAQVVKETLQELPRARELFSSGLRRLVSGTRAAWRASIILPELKAWKPECVHAHFIGMPAAVGCLLSQRLRLPFSVSVHARDVFVPTVRVAKICTQARFVAACSEHARETLMTQLPGELRDRILHIPHDIECSPVPPERSASVDSVFRLLSVCRLVPKKGIDVVLRALSLLQAESPGRYQYRILGEGPESGWLSDLVQQLKLTCVDFVGPVSPDTVRRELERADVFVLGTRVAPDGDRDGIPNALLEAMAAGVPVVVSDAGGISEIVQHRVTGWLLPQNNPLSIAEALREVYLEDELRRAVVKNAHAAIWNRFAENRNGRVFAQHLASRISGRRI